MGLGARDRCLRGLERVGLFAWLAACSSSPEEPLPTPVVEEAPAAPEAEVPAPPALPPAPAVDAALPAAPGAVRLGGEPVVIGAMGQDALLRVVEAGLPALSRCVRGTPEEPDVVVKLIIKDGVVSGATMRTSSGSASVDRCLEKAFLDLRFPDAGMIVANVPLTLGE